MRPKLEDALLSPGAEKFADQIKYVAVGPVIEMSFPAVTVSGLQF